METDAHDAAPALFAPLANSSGVQSSPAGLLPPASAAAAIEPAVDDSRLALACDAGESQMQLKQQQRQQQPAVQGSWSGAHGHDGVTRTEPSSQAAPIPPSFEEPVAGAVAAAAPGALREAETLLKKPLCAPFLRGAPFCVRTRSEETKPRRRA